MRHEWRPPGVSDLGARGLWDSPLDPVQLLCSCAGEDDPHSYPVSGGEFVITGILRGRVCSTHEFRGIGDWTTAMSAHTEICHIDLDCRQEESSVRVGGIGRWIITAVKIQQITRRRPAVASARSTTIRDVLDLSPAALRAASGRRSQRSAGVSNSRLRNLLFF